MSMGSGNNKLFVDYHQTKQERSDSLKLKMINQSNKMFNSKGRPNDMGMMKSMPHSMRAFNNVFGPHMLRKFPPQTMMVKQNMQQMPPMNYGMPGMMPGMGGIDPQQMEGMDQTQRRDFYGERLFTKISSNPQYSAMNEYFSKIVGIFLDLDDQVIERLINDDTYFSQQVNETVRLLTEKTSSN